MPAAYLDWLTDLFEEAQVPYTPATADLLDEALRTLADAQEDDEETVYRALQRKWLRHGPSGTQLLAGLLRGHVYSRRDSTMRPKEGDAYYTNPK
jgi:hypothetical protein